MISVDVNSSYPTSMTHMLPAGMPKRVSYNMDLSDIIRRAGGIGSMRLAEEFHGYFTVLYKVPEDPSKLLLLFDGRYGATASGIGRGVYYSEELIEA